MIQTSKEEIRPSTCRPPTQRTPASTPADILAPESGHPRAKNHQVLKQRAKRYHQERSRGIARPEIKRGLLRTPTTLKGDGLRVNGMEWV